MRSLAQATLIIYHRLQCLSTTFLNFFQKKTHPLILLVSSILLALQWSESHCLKMIHFNHLIVYLILPYILHILAYRAMQTYYVCMLQRLVDQMGSHR